MEKQILDFFKQHIDELRDGTMPKGKFIGKYMDLLKEFNLDKNEMYQFKIPHVVSKQPKDDPTNTWLNYILEMSDEEFEHFKEGLG